MQRTLKQILRENLLKEEKYDITKDPKALVLLDYLSECYPEEEYGLVDIVTSKPPSVDERGFRVYTIMLSVPTEFLDEGEKGFWILTDDELKVADSEGYGIGGYNVTKIGNYNIID